MKIKNLEDLKKKLKEISEENPVEDDDDSYIDGHCDGCIVGAAELARDILRDLEGIGL